MDSDLYLSSFVFSFCKKASNDSAEDSDRENDSDAMSDSYSEKSENSDHDEQNRLKIVEKKATPAAEKTKLQGTLHLDLKPVKKHVSYVIRTSLNMLELKLRGVRLTDSCTAMKPIAFHISHILSHFVVFSSIVLSLVANMSSRMPAECLHAGSSPQSSAVVSWSIGIN